MSYYEDHWPLERCPECKDDLEEEGVSWVPGDNGRGQQQTGRGMTPEQVIEAGRRFLEANTEAMVLGNRPTDPDFARVAGVPLFSADKALVAALKSRGAREDFIDALEAWDSQPATSEDT